MLILSENMRLASGGVRDVYIHPEISSKCIKVDKTFGGTGELSTLAEIKFFEQCSDRPANFPAYFGTVQTNLGTGTVFELIRDEKSGTPAQTLFQLMSKPHTRAEKTKISKALHIFNFRLVKSQILCRDITAHNVVAKETENGHLILYLIDGFGHPGKKSYSSVHLYIKIYRQLIRRRLGSYSSLKKHCMNLSAEKDWSAGPRMQYSE